MNRNTKKRLDVVCDAVVIIMFGAAIGSSFALYF